MSATFRVLSKEDKPTTKEPVLLLLEKKEYTGRSTKAELFAIMAMPVLAETLEGTILVGFKLPNDDNYSVTDYRIKGWCDIDTTPPSKEQS